MTEKFPPRRWVKTPQLAAPEVTAIHSADIGSGEPLTEFLSLAEHEHLVRMAKAGAFEEAADTVWNSDGESEERAALRAKARELRGES